MVKPDDMFTDLAGKVITITGGSRGLGKEMAFAFSRFGDHVVALFSRCHSSICNGCSGVRIGKHLVRTDCTTTL